MGLWRSTPTSASRGLLTSLFKEARLWPCGMRRLGYGIQTSFVWLNSLTGILSSLRRLSKAPIRAVLSFSLLATSLLGAGHYIATGCHPCQTRLGLWTKNSRSQIQKSERNRTRLVAFRMRSRRGPMIPGIGLYPRCMTRKNVARSNGLSARLSLGLRDPLISSSFCTVNLDQASLPSSIF